MLSKIEELFHDVRELNRKYKCVPLIIFTVIYIAATVDFIPEIHLMSWLGYLDDMAILLGTCILTYMEVFPNERNNKSNERIEGIYSAVRRNTVELGSRWNTNDVGRFCGDDAHDIPINQPQSSNFAESGLGTAANDQPPEPEQFVYEPTLGEQQPSESAECFFEQQIIANASRRTDEWVQQAEELSRPDSFIIDSGNTIIW